MLSELVKSVQDSVKPEIIKIGDKSYSSRELFEIPDEPLAPVLSTSTLQSVVDYLENKIDGETEALFIHIVDFNIVRICKFLNDDRRREVLLHAEYDSNGFSFSTRHDQESFITALQSSFVETEERLNIQKVVGGLVEDSSVKLTDDGVSQNTVAKSGVTLVDRASIKNPVNLAPFRTFAEIAQPVSPFILRLHRQSDAPPLISLHEADNSKWKIEAINNIKEFLADKVTVPVIA